MGRAFLLPGKDKVPKVNAYAAFESTLKDTLAKVAPWVPKQQQEPPEAGKAPKPDAATA